MHHKSILPIAENLLGVMAQGLSQKPRVAANCAWFIHNFAASFESEENNPLNKYYLQVVQALLTAADRPEASQFQLRSAAYESLNVVLATCPPGYAPFIFGSSFFLFSVHFLQCYEVP